MEPTEADRERHRQTVHAYEERLATLEALAAMGNAEQKARLRSSIERLKKTGPPAFKPRLAVFGPAVKPHRTQVHLGGDYRNLGARVTPGVPAVLPRLASRRGDGEPPDRLDLARWLVDPAHPLTARVEVNRVWQYLFGTGLVATPDDFGTQGDPPIQPELLDHLATRLVESGWSRKALMRAIVRSASYRQASLRRPEIDARDPSNRGIHRQNRFWLEAEIVRDVGLAASGLLDRTFGGPSIRPPLPANFRSFGYKFRWYPDAAPAVYRRGVYILYQRNMVYPTLRTFDRPDTNVACVRRERSNTPLQALTLLNDPQAVETSRALAHRLLREPGRSTGERVEALHLLCLGRGPTDEERNVLECLLATLRERYSEAPDEAAALAGPATEGDAATDVLREEIAAWIGVGRVLMNTDEFITRE
jgi:hypothetical protein